MAKKKETPASPFVPVEEQPYPIPENWCWTYIGNCYEVTSSRRVHKADWKESGIPFYRTRELVKLSENGYVDNELFISDELYERLVAKYGKPKMGDILISGVGTIGVPYIVKSDTSFYFKDGNIIWFQCKGVCLPEYIFYLYKSDFMDNLIHDMSAGTTVDTYTIINANRTMFPLPPLAEQNRIVSRIESLFAKLDEAKEKAQAVVDGFELRKSVILHKAFTGELTERWRKEHGVGLDSWKDTTLSEIVSEFKYGTSEKSTYNNTGMPVLRIPNVGAGTLSFEDMKYLAHNDIDEANQIHENDLLIIRSNGSRDLVGKCAIVPALSRKYAYASFLIRIKPSEQILPDYLALYLNSTDARTQMFKKAKSSAGIHNINLQELGSITINVPTVYEQSTLIAVLNRLLSKEQQAKEAAEAVLSQIDTIKKAILARAFRGELGTNDPTEEWAGKLLKTILER